MQRIYGIVTDGQRAIPYAQVSVYNSVTGALVTLYDPNGPATPVLGIANPLTADALGFWICAVPDGRYDVEWTPANGPTRRLRFLSAVDSGTSTALAALTPGVVVNTAANAWATRTLTGTVNQVIIANGSGVAGDPTFSLPQNIHAGASPTFAGGTYTGAVSITGSSDAVQWQVKGNATQTANILEIRNSANALLVNVTNAGLVAAVSLQATGLTSGRVPFAGAAGLLGDNANFTYVPGTGLTINNTTAATSPIAGALVVAGGIAVGGFGGVCFWVPDSVALRNGDNSGASVYYMDVSNLVIRRGDGSSATGNVKAFGSILSVSSANGIGYGAGAGGAVTQATSKATGVTLNTVCGTITLNNAALAANTSVAFTLTNSAIAATDYIAVQHDSVGTLGAYSIVPTPGVGSATITVRNNTAGALSEAIVLRFALIKAVTA